MLKILKKKGFIIKKFEDKSIFSLIEKIIKKNFSNNDKFYASMPRKKFSKLALKCQKEINQLDLIKKFHYSEKNFLNKILKNDQPMYSSSGYLRCVRPAKNSVGNDFLPFHRETFYSRRKSTPHCVNVWFPIMNVTKENIMKYVPNSHKIPDKKIKRRRIKQNGYKISKHSSEHKLGFAYAPKKISKGVNLNKAVPFQLKKGEFLAFSTMLIHGNGENKTNAIRHAFGFGIIPKSKVTTKKIDSKGNSYREIN